MLTSQRIQLIAVLLLNFDSSWVTLLSTTTLCLVPAVRQNIVLLLILPSNFSRQLLEDMGLTYYSLIVIHCDNHYSIQIAHNDAFHECTKHVKIDCHHVCHHLDASTLHLLFVRSTDQTVDIFTNTFPPGRFRDFVFKLKMA